VKPFDLLGDPTLMTKVASRETTRLLALQALRTIAAMTVVLLHAQELIGLHAVAHGHSFTHFKAIPFGAGVDLFFVISGFVVVYASQKLFCSPGGRAEFVRRRLVRIIPLYWTALTLRLAVLAVGAGVGAKLFPDATAIVTSYLFIPYDSLGFGADYPFPILDLGWTLNYEMFFYALFACFMGFRRDVAVPAAVTCLVGGVLIATVFPPENLAVRFWLHPISVEFAAGAVIALLFIHGLVLNGVMRIALVLGGFALWLVPVAWFGDTSGPGFYTWIRVMVWGLGAVMIIAGAALGHTGFKSAWSRAIADLGDSSYALYLLHPFVFLIFKAVLGKIELPQVAYWPSVLLITALAIAAAALFHKYAETPVVAFLREKTRPRASVPAVRVG